MAAPITTAEAKITTTVHEAQTIWNVLCIDKRKGGNVTIIRSFLSYEAALEDCKDNEELFGDADHLYTVALSQLWLC
jgi:hypothetical protein